MKILLQQKKRLFAYIAFIMLIVFVVSPVFSLFYLFNESKTKDQILAQFNNKDYNVKINGHITPELWHGLSLKIHSISIATKNNQELFHIGSMSCQFSWFEAVFGNYKLRRISIDDVDFYEKNVLTYGVNNLFNNKSFNFSNFKELAYFNINYIHSVGNTIPYRFDDGNLKVYWENEVPQFLFGTKLIDNNMYLTATGSFDNFTQDAITFNRFNTTLYNQSLNLQTSGTAIYQFNKNILTLKNINGNTNFMGYSGKINAANIDVSKTGVEAKNTSLALNISKNFFTQNITLNFVNLSSIDYQGLFSSQAHLQYKSSFEKNSLELYSVFNNLVIESNGSINSRSCTNNLSIKAPDIINNNIKASISGICEYIADNKLFNFQLSGNLNNKPLQLDVQVLNKNKPSVIVAGNINNLNLSNVNQNKIMPLYYDKSQLPFSWLSFIDMDAKLNINNLTFDRINLTEVKTDFNIANSQLNLKQFQAKLYNGNLVATGSITKNTDNSYNIMTKQKFDNLDIKLMFKNLFDVEAISGSADVLTDINTKNVTSYNDLHKKLNGIVDIKASTGAFQGIDFNLFTSPKALTLTSIKMTPFKALNAHFNFIDGVSKNGTINFSSPYLITDGHGTIDFINTTLNYDLMIKSQLPNNSQKIKAVVIPVTATGDLFNPKINIEKIYLSDKKSILKKIKSAFTRHHKTHSSN